MNNQVQEVVKTNFPVEVIEKINNPKDLQSALEKFDDQTLVDYGYMLQEKTYENWLRQACIASILVRRHEGWGPKLAALWGVSKNWVYELSYIWNKIITPMVEQGEHLPPLPPSFYHEALRAKDPIEAIKQADEAKSMNPSFTVREFRKSLAANREEANEMLESCKSCRFYEVLKDVPFSVIFNGQRIDGLTGTIHACRYGGVLKIEMNFNPTAKASNCMHYWQK